MPHRVNKKGDIGTAKSHSDSYDAHNIYLTEEGWVYRHYKTADKTMWWDEIIVAGQVKPGMTIHGVPNSHVTETNPKKLGTEYTPEKWEDGTGNSDFRYSDHMVGDPATVLNRIVVKPEDKTHEPGDLYKLQDAVKGTPSGWSGPSDPSMPPEKPPFAGEDYQACNEYNIRDGGLPTPGYETDPRSVIVGTPDGTCGPTISQTAVTISSSSGNDFGSTLTASNGDGVDGDGNALTPTYEWTGAKTGTGATITADVAGNYTVTATVTDGTTTKTSSYSWNINARAGGVYPVASFTQLDASTAPGNGYNFSIDINLTAATKALDEYNYSVRVKEGHDAADYYLAASYPTVSLQGDKLVYSGPAPDVYSANVALFEIVATYNDDAEYSEVIATPTLLTQAFACDAEPVFADSNNAEEGVTSANVAKISIAYLCGLELGDGYGYTNVTAPGSTSVDIDGEGLIAYYDTSAGSSYSGPLTYTFEGTYHVGTLDNVTTFSVVDREVNPDSTVFETPQAVNGYYPLYTSEANANAAGDGTSHTHEFDGTTYYMPNGVTFYHGTYNNGGGSGY